MLFIKRDQEGNIVAVTSSPEYPEQPQASEGDILEFLSSSGTIGNYETLLTLLDTKVIRVLDDLLDLLVKKNVIMFSELPHEAQEKIMERKRIRKKMQEDNDLTVDDIL